MSYSEYGYRGLEEIRRLEKQIRGDLFQKIDFISHAGNPLTWKIECDAISPQEWDCLAHMVMERQKEPFSSVEGIPRGGIPFANALSKYASGDQSHQPMIVDDIFTTGKSFIDYMKENYSDSLAAYGHKWVVFARKKSNVHPFHVRALFTMVGD